MGFHRAKTAKKSTMGWHTKQKTTNNDVYGCQNLEFAVKFRMG